MLRLGASVEGSGRTLTCVLVMPCTGTVVGEGVGGMGVSVAEGTAVGSSVAVMMNGVAVAPLETPMRVPQAASRMEERSQNRVRRCTGQL